MYCPKCNFKPIDKFIDDRLESLYNHFQECHPDDLKIAISPVCLIEKDAEK